MSFDTKTRNRLAAFVGKCRKLLCGDFKTPGGEMARLLAHYGIQDTGTCFPVDELTHLDEPGRETACTLRAILEHKQTNAPAAKVWKKFDPAVYDLIQEQGFTVLNRLCALRMAEERKILQFPCISKGLQSDSFLLYDGDPAQGTSGITGKANADISPEDRYQHFLFSLFDELSLDLGSLFDRFSPQGLLFPGTQALDELLEELNHPDLAALWGEDETIGWIYQYWNSQEERKAMRDASAAPRNSRELAVRNQFFTPRYVVQFLTENTLGRTWYEMTQGNTALKDNCTYLVRRSSEIFLRSLDQSYRSIYGEDAQMPGNLCETDAFAALYQGKVEPAVSGQEGFFELAGGALSDESFQSHIGETWEQYGNECIDELREAILNESEHPRKNDLAWGWAVVTQFIANSQIGSPYAQEAIDKLNTYFRELLKKHSETDGLSQEDILKKPVLIPHRPIKDPREIRLLDPACGSMHFGLYAFDLFETIYSEAWDLDVATLREDFPTKEALLLEMPRLIIEHNIHGVDIDPRATQIAGLALWLRAQRTWKNQGVSATDRPKVKRSNIVCAEPMPGDQDQLAEFTAKLHPAIAQMVAHIFDKMQLAGEAGSLLKIEEEITALVDEAKDAWKKIGKHEGEMFSAAEIVNADGRTGTQQILDTGDWNLSTLSSISHNDFFEKAESEIYAQLARYAETAGSGSYKRKLFANDAAHGFALIDLCSKRYEAVVMNPPFGEWSAKYKAESKKAYPVSYNDIMGAFVERGGRLLNPGGRVGSITSRTCFFLSSFTKWREQIVLDLLTPEYLVDLGHGVMDAAMVEAAAYVLLKPQTSEV